MYDTSQPVGASSPAFERASARDRTYFEAHPSARVYVRKRILGEFPQYPLADDLRTDAYTEVEQISGVARMRRPIRMMRSRDYPGGKIPLEHLEAIIENAEKNGDMWRPIPNSEVDDGEGGAA
jgi:hypothetical protein